MNKVNKVTNINNAARIAADNEIMFDAITTANTKAFFDALTGDTVNNVLLADIWASVEAIPTASLPLQPRFKAFADEMVKRLEVITTASELVAAKTMRNKRAMIRLATVEALQARLDAALAQVRLMDATTAAKKKAAENAIAKAAKALEERPTSLDKAATKGRQIIDRKASNVTGFAKQTAASKAKQAAKAARKANPAASEANADNDKRTAHKELILQALDNARTVSANKDASNTELRVAVDAVAHVAALIVGYLPAEMRTL